MNLAELEARMREWLDGDYEAHLFELDITTIGYALYRRDLDGIYIRQFFIRREFRRQGHGRFAFNLTVQPNPDGGTRIDANRR